ncbi:winged helix-turn-helix transcriptional regulator [Lysobacter yangpyeongensis]|jgi:DNA-binding HxlR family transcriptional regulator|uniref:Winged helix-turn-helix transcriptional regulator n=1 Tax=Lysobacter yangpyeongensis TaxID=346182 RepID=A0ABW0SQY4_9GAMM
MADVYSSMCPSRAVLELIAGKWTLLIVPLLARGPERNNALLRKIDGISQKVLSQTLRDLEANGLVMRIDHHTVPPHVDYRLTELGHSLSRALEPVDRWAEANLPRIEQAKARAATTPGPAPDTDAAD